jgi:hypothetical protein
VVCHPPFQLRYGILYRRSNPGPAGQQLVDSGPGTERIPRCWLRPGSNEGDYIDWLTINDNARSVIADVRRIRNHPLVPDTIPIYGYIYDVTTGLLVDVPGASAIGAAGR